MSTVVVVKCPEGLVLAADSRMNVVEKQKPPWSTDTLLKILSFKQPHNFVGAVTYGAAQINQKTPYCYLPEFEKSLPDERIPIDKFAEELSHFFLDKWNESPERKYSPESINSMNFLLAGFDEKDEYGRVFEIKISDNLQVADKRELHKGSKTAIVCRGNLRYASRLWLGYPKELPRLLSITMVPYWTQESAVTDLLKYAMSKQKLRMRFSSDYLRDAVALAKLLIRTEIDAQALTEGPEPGSKAVTGGPIRICTIMPEHGLTWVL